MRWTNTLQYKKIFLPSRKLHFASFFWSFRLDVAKGLVTPGGWHLNCVTFITCEQDLRAHCIVFRLMGGVFGVIYINKSDGGQTSDTFWRTVRVPVSWLSFYWHTIIFLMLFCSNSAHFSEIQLVCDERTDGRTDGPTDTPSYRDARTHLKDLNSNKSRTIWKQTNGLKTLVRDWP